MDNKKYYFGWENIKWFLSEVNKMYSNQDSFFSKKRVESGIAFIVLQWGLIHWMLLNVKTITAQDLTLWCICEFAICGYTLNAIQKEKLVENKDQSKADTEVK